jgi:hypothetical protein
MAQRPVHFWYEIALPLRYGIRRASGSVFWQFISGAAS